MRILTPSFALMLLTTLPQSGSAAIRPSFGGESEAWRATDIVLVTTSQPDSTFEVNEVWKGNLHTGARIVVPELIPSKDALPISHYPSSFPLTYVYRSSLAEHIPRQPVGSQLILFLRRKSSELREAEWEPAHPMDSMKASVVWIEGEQLYGFEQVINPGPSILQPLGSSLQVLKERVAKVIHIQDEMQSILGTPVDEQRASLLKPYVNSDVFYARQLALQELGKSGPTAVGTIREMLNDPAYADQAPELIEAMVNAGGETVGTDLTRRLQQEVTFWESTGPSLPKGWWNEDASPNAPLRSQYDETLQLIIGLQEVLDKDALAPAEQLHDLWVSYPQLNDPSGLNHMSLECGKLITMLQSN